MTTAKIAQLYKARRVGKGRWMAHCPSHGRDRTPSLGISEGKRLGATVVRCYAGCDVNDVLTARGLTFRDLFADSMPDREAMKLADKMRAEEERRRKEKRRQEREAIDLARKWEACRNALGLLLIQRPGDSKLCSLFHHACDMCRELPPTGYWEPGVDLSGVFPQHNPLDGITAQDVGRQIANILKLPSE